METGQTVQSGIYKNRTEPEKNETSARLANPYQEQHFIQIGGTSAYFTQQTTKQTNHHEIFLSMGSVDT